jgi:hypothetical protein
MRVLRRLIARQCTSVYPQRVVGLVLVEAIPETLETDLSVSDCNGYDQLLLAPVPGIGEYPDVENVDFRQSFAQMRRAGMKPPRRIPAVVISRGEPAGIPGELGTAVEAAWAKGHDYLAQLQPGTPHLTSVDSDHEIEFEDPKVVIDAAQRVIAAVRAGRPSVD